jgi:O-antigen/teichoic acid export membrane protein
MTSTADVQPATDEDAAIPEVQPSLRCNTLWNLAGLGLPLVAGIVAIPHLLARLGTERFGIVTLLWALIGYLGLFDFGLGRAVTQLTAQNVGQSCGDRNVEVLRTAVFLTGALGVAGGLLLALLARPLAHRALGISAPEQQDAVVALMLTGLVIPLTTLSAAFRGALEGHERFREVNVARLFLGIATFLFPAAAVTLASPTLPIVVLSLLASRIATLAIFVRYMHRLYPAYRLGIHPSRAHRKALLSFGSWMTVSNVVSPVLVNIERFVLAGAAGAAFVASYTVPFEIVVRLQILPGAIGASMFPRLAAAGGNEDAVRLVRRGAWVTAALLGTCCAALTAFYVPVVSLWLDAPFARTSFPVAGILAAGALVNGVGYIFYTAVQARAGARATGILHVVELALYLPAVLLLVRHLGATGAALAWTARATVDATLLMWLYWRRRSVV